MTVQDGSIEKNRKGSYKSEMKEEKIQLISQKCKGPQETTMNIYTNKLDNLEEVETFLQNKREWFLRGNHEETENLNTPITSKDIESVTKNLTTNKSPGPEASLINSNKR